jgi:hypothetical protein
MLRIVPLGVFKNGFDLVDEADQVVAAFRGSPWRESGQITAEGEPYGFRRDGRRRFTLDSPSGTLATAQRRSIWSARWDVAVRSQAYELVRAGWFTRTFLVRSGGAEVGRIARVGALRRGGTVDLPVGMPSAARAFIAAVVVTQWNRDDKAAAT